MLEFFTGFNQKHFDDWTLLGRPGRVVTVLPVESECDYPGCGWDSFSQSAKLVGCPHCGGAGKLFVWQRTTVRARVVWGNTGLNYMTPAPGIELGDCYLTFSADNTPLVNEILNAQRAYIEVDGRKVRPSNTSPSVIPNVGEALLVTCNIYTDITAAQQ